MRYSFFLSNPQDKSEIRNNSLNERTPLISENRQESYQHTNCIYNQFNISDILEFFGYFFLFFSHATAIYQKNYKISGALDMVGSLFLVICSIKSDKIIPAIFMVMWFSLGISQVVVHNSIIKNNITLY